MEVTVKKLVISLLCCAIIATGFGSHLSNTAPQSPSLQRKPTKNKTTTTTIEKTEDPIYSGDDILFNEYYDDEKLTEKQEESKAAPESSIKIPNYFSGTQTSKRNNLLLKISSPALIQKTVDQLSINDILDQVMRIVEDVNHASTEMFDYGATLPKGTVAQYIIKQGILDACVKKISNYEKVHPQESYEIARALKPLNIAQDRVAKLIAHNSPTPKQGPSDFEKLEAEINTSVEAKNKAKDKKAAEKAEELRKLMNKGKL